MFCILLRTLHKDTKEEIVITKVSGKLLGLKFYDYSRGLGYIGPLSFLFMYSLIKIMDRRMAPFSPNWPFFYFMRLLRHTNYERVRHQIYVVFNKQQ